MPAKKTKMCEAIYRHISISIIAAILALLVTASGAWAFPSVAVTDTFTRANENPLAGSWVTATAWWVNPLKLVSNQVVPSINDTYQGSFYNGQYGPNFEAYVDVVTAQGTDAKFIIMEFSVQREDVEAAPDGYNLTLNRVAGAYEVSLYRMDDGAYTQLGSTAPVGGTPQAIGVARSGSSIVAWVKVAGVWTAMVSTTDATYIAAMYPVLAIDSANDAVLDNFGAGTISGVSTPVVSASDSSGACDSAGGFDVPITISAGTGNALFWYVYHGVTSTTVSSVVWDPTGANQALTSIGTAVTNASTNSAIQAFRLVNPATGTSNVRVKLSTTQACFSGGFVSTGVDQTTPVRAGSYTTAADKFITVTSQAGDITSTMVLTGVDVTSADQTLIASADTGFGGTGFDYAVATGDMTHTWHGSAFDDPPFSAILGFSIAAGSAPAASTSRRRGQVY